ncbi:fibronectin type III domain-containing protein [Candidatus Woesebacteria bacterium]|nr:fibronectin type III domain-containing protein [Candidatus Woesebacteria bacterium]
MDSTKIATLEHSRPRRNTKLIGIGVGLVLSFLLLTAISTAYMSGIFVSATNDSPTELIIRNVTDTSAQIYWSTQSETQGLVQYGTNPTELSLIAPEVVGGKEHTVDVTLLKPSSTYYFNLRIGDKIFDNGGTPWTFATKLAGNAPDQMSGSAPDTSMPASDVTSTCPQTDNCAVIRERLGQGCTTADYSACLQKNK